MLNVVRITYKKQSKLRLLRFLERYAQYHNDISNNRKSSSHHLLHSLSSKYQNADEASSKLKQTNEWIQTEVGKNAILNFTKEFKNSLNINESKDIISYIDSRNQNIISSFKNEEDHLSFVRTLSALLTFPLTLSYSLNSLFKSSELTSNSLMVYKDGRVNVLILGARSESSLPLIWWKECMLAAKTFNNIDIRMIGPGLQVNKNTIADSSVSFEINNDPNRVITKRLSIINNHISSLKHNDSKSSIDMTTLHQHSQCLELMQWADVFVLYNPGFGNDNLKSSWDPTIRLLLQTHKPIICTAYGNHDLKRDLSVLDQITSEEDSQDLGEPIDFLIPPHENPFQSFKLTVDPKETGDQGIVVTNHSLYAICAK